MRVHLCMRVHACMYAYVCYYQMHAWMRCQQASSGCKHALSFAYVRMSVCVTDVYTCKRHWQASLGDENTVLSFMYVSVVVCLICIHMDEEPASTSEQRNTPVCVCAETRPMAACRCHKKESFECSILALQNKRFLRVHWFRYFWHVSKWFCAFELQKTSKVSLHCAWSASRAFVRRTDAKENKWMCCLWFVFACIKTVFSCESWRGACLCPSWY